VIELVLFLVVLVAVVRWVSGPLRRPPDPVAAVPDAALAAERDARLAAVRDAELDLQTGKLSAEEHRELDARLRAEAIAALDRAGDRPPPDGSREGEAA
jgi:hypothetical protein